MFTVFFKKKNYNPFRSYYQNQNRYAGSRSFNTETEAREFAKTVDTNCIINPCGHKI